MAAGRLNQVENFGLTTCRGRGRTFGWETVVSKMTAVRHNNPPTNFELELGVGGENPEEGSLNAVGTPPSSPHFRLGFLIAHDCFDFAPIYVKNLKYTRVNHLGKVTSLIHTKDTNILEIMHKYRK